MATKKKKPAPPAKKAKPAPAAKKAAPATTFGDDEEDPSLVDTSGTFRAVSAIQQAQVGHSEDVDRFASDSLVMRAQQDGFVEAGPSMVDAADENVADDEAASAQKRERLATLQALDEKRRKQRR
jgi:hypothetical protein